MSIQSDLVALVSPLLGGRFYPMGDAPPYTDTYATYFRVANNEQLTLDRNGGTGNASNTRIQIDVYSLSYGGAQAAASAIKAALNGSDIESTSNSEQDGYEPDTKLHSVMLDISTWHL